MRILLVSDLHYTLPPARLGRRAPRRRSTWWCSPATTSTSVRRCRSTPRSSWSCATSRCCSRRPVVVSSGNHDLTGPDAHGEQAALWLGEARSGGRADRRRLAAARRHADHRSARGGTVRPAVPRWRRSSPPMRARRPARGSGSTTGRRSARRRAGPAGATTATPTWPDWIDEHRPDVVLTGHVHEPPFKPDGAWADRIGDTWVFNAGRQIGPVPTTSRSISTGDGDVAVDAGRRERCDLAAARRRRGRCSDASARRRQ